VTDATPLDETGKAIFWPLTWRELTLVCTPLCDTYRWNYKMTDDHSSKILCYWTNTMGMTHLKKLLASSVCLSVQWNNSAPAVQSFVQLYMCAYWRVLLNLGKYERHFTWKPMHVWQHWLLVTNVITDFLVNRVTNISMVTIREQARSVRSLDITHLLLYNFCRKHFSLRKNLARCALKHV